MTEKKTIRFGYASSKNVTFRGYIETDYTREEWDALPEAEQDEFRNDLVWELVEVWVEDDK